MTTDELILYYTDLLIAQYNDKSRARSMVAALVAEVLADQIIQKVRAGFDIDTAIGKQLDILGKYSGTERAVKGLPLNLKYFAMPSYNDPNASDYVGFALYGETTTNYFVRYGDTSSSVFSMKDDMLRKLVKLRIRKQRSDHSVKDIDGIIEEFFGDTCYMIDGGDMTMTYVFDPAPGDVFPSIAVFTDSLPKPAGVKLIISGAI